MRLGENQNTIEGYTYHDVEEDKTKRKVKESNRHCQKTNPFLFLSGTFQGTIEALERFPIKISVSSSRRSIDLEWNAENEGVDKYLKELYTPAFVIL